MTAVGRISRIFLGARRDDPALRGGAELLVDQLPGWNDEKGTIDMYCWYYGTLAMFHVGGSHWKKWNHAMKGALVDTRRTEGGTCGSWDPIGAWGGAGGRIHATAVNVLSLEITYRYRRVFRQRITELLALVSPWKLPSLSSSPGKGDGMRADAWLTLVLLGPGMLLSTGCSQEQQPGPVPGPEDSPVAPARNVRHVALTGTDASSGTAERPWRTIQHAVDTATPGTAITIREGRYDEEVIIGTSGSAGAPIVLAGAPGELVTTTLLELRKGVVHLEISNLHIEGFRDWGVTLNGSNHDITLRTLTTIGGEAGLRITYGDSGQPPEEGPVSRVVVEDCVIRDCLYTGIDCTPGPCDHVTVRRTEVSGAGLVGESSFGADGIAVERGSNILVEGCYIHDNGGDGIDLNSRDTAGQVTGVVVRNNRVVRNRRNGVKLWAGGRMEQNSIWGQGETPVVVGVFPGTYELVNNTIAYNMMDPAFSSRGYSLVASYPEFPEDRPVSARIRLTMVNNIIASNCGVGDGPTGIYLGAGVELVRMSNNLHHSREDGEILALFLGGEREFTRAEIADGTWARETGQGEGTLAAEPRFVSAWPSVDLHLEAGSPAVDAGTSEGAPRADLEGRVRPQSGGHDLGVYER